jgi:hypothetical protein
MSLECHQVKFLFGPGADSRATHPASSKLLKNVEEAPLSRGEFPKELNSQY